MTQIPDEPKWDPEQYERPFREPIGRLIINFGFLEKAVDWTITAFLLVHERQGEAVTSQILNLTSRIRLVNKLCSLLTDDEEERKSIKEIMACVTRVSLFRNKVVHGPWGAYNVNERSFQKVWTHPMDLKLRHVNLTIDAINEAANDCVRSRANLQNRTQDIIRAYELRKAGQTP